MLVAPDNVIPPPSAEASDVFPSAKTMFLSSTVKVVELMVVVDPLTVKFPVIVKLSKVPTDVISERFPVVITVPVIFGIVIVRSAVGSVTDKVVSKSFAVPSKIIPAGARMFLLPSSSATPSIELFSVSSM